MTNQTNATAHTGEPWYAHGPDIRTNADERVNIYDHDPSNRERIVACINALAGIPDPAAFVKQAKELQAENAALRTALADAIRRPLGVVPASAERFYDQTEGKETP
jgi:hypothetical protein